jgi:hypothetical protein
MVNSEHFHQNGHMIYLILSLELTPNYLMLLITNIKHQEKKKTTIAADHFNNASWKKS